MKDDHKRIGRRLLGSIFAHQLLGFLAVDCVLALGVALGSGTGLRVMAARIGGLPVTWGMLLGAVVLVEILCLVATTKGLRRAVREQVEPLRELRVARDDIAARYEKLEAAYAAQSKFVSDASHELRTPIAVIQGYANLLDRWGKNDQKALQESIDAIKNEAASMKALVEQLLFLARGDNHSILMAMENIHLSEVAEEVVRGARLIDAGHEYFAEIAPALWMYGDEQLIKQALRILVDNATKYTPAGGRIAVRAAASSRRAGYVEISVSDTGIGIPEEALPHIFDRFYRAEESRARKSGGTGLGLAIAKWIVDTHRGTVEVVSRRDVGTRFTLLFPGVAAPQETGSGAAGGRAANEAEAGLAMAGK